MPLARFEHFPKLIARAQPSVLIEIGVHKGARTQLMIHEAMKHRKEIAYVGFDIFEGGDMEFQKAAWNAKGIATEAEAQAVLRQLERQYPFRLATTLVVGDTREMLAGREIKADFVFIDGDHRLDTIRSDYEAVKGSRCIVFDDYYGPDERGQCPDVSAYGCNGLVTEIGATVLPKSDPCRPCGRVHLAVLWNQREAKGGDAR